MEKKNNAVWWVLGIIAVAVIVFFVVRSQNMTDEVGDGTPNDSQTTGGDDALVAEPTEDVSAGSVNANVNPTAMLTYQQALAQYGSDRIQFDSQCSANPSTQTWKNNTKIMLDNRSAKPLNLTLGTLGTMSIKAWGFKIVNLSSSMLPNVITIDCGAKQNVAQINIQK